MLHRYYHSTTPDNARSILLGGFQDRCDSGLVGKSGVWVGSIPAITSIALDQFLGHLEESWLMVEVPFSLEQYWIPDDSWPGLQFLVPAVIINQGIITEISAVDVIQTRRKQSVTFLDNLWATIEELRPNYDLLTNGDEREWYRSEFGDARLISRVEAGIEHRDRYLKWLRAIASAAPECQQRAIALASEALTI